MKHLTIIALALTVSATAFAQQPTKKLPAKVTITLTDKQILRLDSVATVINGAIDSKQTTNWILQGFVPIFQQVQQQMVADSSKVVKPVNKKP